ncbi:MAG: hypothetical protein A2289_08425 [Deltaproteobacteria bacterium RIFOXYA12_FULL_58_15]|nr:MAG: hypothetical protein A2289_08425 [Deltaproteobacteria bacterium RIFOXYA12_FULL_58_15]OGR09404.1 MAG: hypothetical protein A2341_20460 [Deltaproteobacteria bacterium RIFOXYB12_FULL_58_9]
MFKLIAFFVSMGWPGMAAAGSVFLNGVNIDGVTNKAFENCQVQIDVAGNVHITAKGYTAELPTPTAATPAAADVGPSGPATRRYWLVTEKSAPGMSQYDIDMFINSKWVRKFRDQEQQVVMEVSKYLQAGKNKIHFVAKKDLGTARRSTSPQHYFRIIIGEGNEGGRNVMISRKLVEYKRTAMETQNSQDEFVLEAK